MFHCCLLYCYSGAPGHVTEPGPGHTGQARSHAETHGETPACSCAKTCTDQQQTAITHTQPHTRGERGTTEVYSNVLMCYLNSTLEINNGNVIIKVMKCEVRKVSYDRVHINMNYIECCAFVLWQVFQQLHVRRGKLCVLFVQGYQHGKTALAGGSFKI